MSRIGKHPVPVPAGVTIEIDGQLITAKGKLGQLSMTVIGRHRRGSGSRQDFREAAQ